MNESAFAERDAMAPGLTTSMLVLGNGQRRLSPYPRAKVVFTFNGEVPPEGQEFPIAVTTKARSTGSEPRVILGTSSESLEGWIRRLSVRVNAACHVQQSALGSVPSSGFAIAHALWTEPGSVCIDGMLFDPSLSRPRELHPRKPLPQMFHNWLGERRLSLYRWLESPREGWCWPLIEGDSDRAMPTNVIDHVELQEALREAQRSGSLGRIEQFAKRCIKPSMDLLKPSAVVRALESCFHLDRAHSDTLNWWLYEASASACIESLAGRLRLAQHQAFSLATREPGVLG